MSEDLSDLINNVKSMMDNGNIPENVKNVLSKISNDNSASNSSNNTKNTSSKTSSEVTSSSTNNLNLDIDTILKLKTIVDNINQKDDPRSKLLYSLKPYLRDNKKDKLDQYVNLLNITKIADIMNNKKKENNGNV